MNAVQSSKKPESAGLKGKAPPELQETHDAPQSESIYALGNARAFPSSSGDSQENNQSNGRTLLSPIVQLQQTLGNQAMLRRIHSGLDPGSIHSVYRIQPMIGNHGVGHRLQTKLTVNTPGDQYEQEADRVAEQVLRMPEPRRAVSEVSPALPKVQRKCACGGTCSKCQAEQSDHEHRLLQMKSAGPNPSAGIPAPPIVHQVLRSPGRPLDPATRAFMEPRFGCDFSHVQLHTDSQAALSAREIHARAYTVGRDIVFADHAFSSATTEGKQLLAHELSHVVQQSSGTIKVQRQPDEDEDDLPPSRVPHRPTSLSLLAEGPHTCPGGGLKYQGVCMTDEILEALPEADFDVKRAEQTVKQTAKKRESAAEEYRKRRERTIKRYGSASVSPYALGNSYDYVLDKRYHDDPSWKKVYDLETFQQIVEARIPKHAAARAQDVRELLSMPTWTAGQQVQWDELREQIKGWTAEEQGLARYLLWRWFEIVKAGRAPIAAKKVIVQMTSQYFELWLRAADKARAEDCKRNPPGFVEKLYRIHGIDRCKPWFDPNHPESGDQGFHGPSELAHFHRLMWIRLSEDESPRSMVFECVNQFRKQTNPHEMLKQMQGAAAASLLTHFATIGQLSTMARMQAAAPPAPALVAGASTAADVTPSPRITAPDKAPSVTPTPGAATTDIPASATAPKAPTAPMKAAPGGGPRGTVTATAKTLTSSKPSQPEVTTLGRSSRPFTPDYAVGPYSPAETDVRGQYRFREFERDGKTYRQAEGRLGMPNEVQTHRDRPAQRRVSRGTGDDAGHMIGNRFGAPGGPENLSRQNWIANRIGNYHSLEDRWAGLRHQGVEVDVRITDVTRPGEQRPFLRKVQWTETAPNGTRTDFEVDFANTTTPESRSRAGSTSTTPGGTGGKLIQGDFRGPQVQRKLSSSVSPVGIEEFAPPIVHDVLRSPGQPLDPATRSFMEPRFGRDFNDVHVYTGARAAESARAVNAAAYTIGNNVIFGAGQFAPNTTAGQKLLAHELAHVVQQRGTSKNSVEAGLMSNGHASFKPASPSAVGLQRQSQPIAATDEPLPKSLQNLSDQDRQSFRGFIVKGLVPLLTAATTRLTGDREHDTSVLTEYFLCANAWSASAILAGGIDPDPLFCTYSEVTRSRPIFSRYKKAVIEPEYDKTPPELLQLLRTRQELFKAINEDLIFIGNKKASLDDKDPNQRQAASLFSSFKTQLTEGLPVTGAQGKPVSPTPELLSTIKTLTDAVRSRKAGSSSTKIDFAIISLLRPRDDDKSPHKQGRAVDISIYAGNHIDMFHPEEALEGIAQLIEDLPPGKYWLGVPRHPRRDQLFGCSDFFSRLFQPYHSRLYQPSLFAPGCPHHPPNIRQEILKTRNMFFPWYFTPGNSYGVDKMEDPEAKLRLNEVLARKAPQVTVSFGPDALDHVHVQLE